MENQVIQGDCLEVMKDIPDNSVDSICCDPPYELGFMGKSWDNTGIANNPEMWREAMRVLKPGGHLLAFSGTRTYHRMASAIEDAGFEVRDMIEWVYGSGFPKSLNIGKAVDKLQGNEREEIEGGQIASTLGSNTMDGGKANPDYKYTKGTSEWEGWGTALKPAHEPICMARKPLSEKTVAENVLKYGTGGINIDESRVGTETIQSIGTKGKQKFQVGNNNPVEVLGEHNGRFPANLIHDNSEEVRECFPETKSGWRNKDITKNLDAVVPFGAKIGYTGSHYEDDNGGNASRFFKSIIYQAKASKSERNKGCEELELKQTQGGGGGIGDYENDVNSMSGKYGSEKAPAHNNHPTVKPIALMEYLINMVTPKGGIVLDPFAGSGTTGVACKNINRNYILIEKEPEYIDIINKRLENTSINQPVITT